MKKIIITIVMAITMTVGVMAAPLPPGMFACEGIISIDPYTGEVMKNDGILMMTVGRSDKSIIGLYVHKTDPKPLVAEMYYKASLSNPDKK